MGKQKTYSLKYSVEFNDFAVQTTAPNTVFEAVGQTLHITVCEKVCGQTRLNLTSPLVVQQTALSLSLIHI